MGYTDKQEIARYITLNEDKIIERLNKLFESAEKVFRGKLKDFDSTDVYINKNGWVLIVDHKKDTLVTLYRVDLKVDDEDLNRVFCEKMINKIHTYKKEYEEASLKGMEQHCALSGASVWETEEKQVTAENWIRQIQRKIETHRGGRRVL